MLVAKPRAKKSTHASDPRGAAPNLVPTWARMLVVASPPRHEGHARVGSTRCGPYSRGRVGTDARRGDHLALPTARPHCLLLRIDATHLQNTDRAEKSTEQISFDVDFN